MEGVDLLYDHNIALDLLAERIAVLEKEAAIMRASILFYQRQLAMSRAQWEQHAASFDAHERAEDDEFSSVPYSGNGSITVDG